MKEPKWDSCTEEDVWKFVGWHLAKNGFATILVGGAVAAIYSPTDCIRDRLASYVHFKARECLDQAVLVAKKMPFDHKKVKAWCKSEGASQVFDDPMKKLKSAQYA